MGKKLAIKGHPTRREEVIELLEMMGGNDSNAFRCNNPNLIYYVLDNHTRWDYIGPEEIDEYNIFTLEEFLVKFPFKVGDVIKFPNDMAEEIDEMRWDEDLEDIIYTSVSGWTRPCCVNNKTNMEIDCKKCGLHFGSVRCFDKDCPHNTPKSYAVGLKDGKVIDCITNKETNMNEIKPLFKAGDIIKLKGYPDKNLYWVVMDVVKDGYIFNDGKKYSFDDQHHYEKTNREVINTQPSKMKNVLAELLEHIKITPKEELEREFEEIKEWSNVGPTVEEFMTFCECVNKKPVYPTTYDECCEIIGISRHDVEIDLPQPYQQKMFNLFNLCICRNAYWKIAGEQMGLDEPWKHNYLKDANTIRYAIYNTGDEIVKLDGKLYRNYILCFPTEEMRDAFYENFKDLIEQCKEFL